MRWLGKLLGVLIGLLLVRHPVGAFVGLVLGHAFDKREGRGNAPRAYGPQQQAQWLDGGKAPDFELEAVLRRVAGLCRGRPDLRSMFLQLQVLAALAGNDLRGRPRELLQKTAAGLGVSGLEFLRMEAAARLFHHHATSGVRAGQGGGQSAGSENAAGNGSGYGSTSGSGGARRSTTLSPTERLAAAYTTLGVKATEDDAAVTRAYRRQMSQNHPDKLAASGLPPAMLEVAKEKTQRIREAWEIIRDARGLR